MIVKRKMLLTTVSTYLKSYSLVNVVVGGRCRKKSAQLNDKLTLLCACHSLLLLFLISLDLSLIPIYLAVFKRKSQSSFLICEIQPSMNFRFHRAFARTEHELW